MGRLAAPHAVSDLVESTILSGAHSGIQRVKWPNLGENIGQRRDNYPRWFNRLARYLTAQGRLLQMKGRLRRQVVEVYLRHDLAEVVAKQQSYSSASAFSSEPATPRVFRSTVTSSRTRVPFGPVQIFWNWDTSPVTKYT